jgi:2-methylcitrate dehydratase PrpD
MPTSGSQCSTEEHIAYGRKLAEFCAGLSLSRLPAEVVDKTKLCILDLIANIYGSLELDAVSRVVRYVRSLAGSEVASALGCGFKTDLHHAAFLNGTAAEAIEAQDGIRFGGNHPGVAVIPAALAVAEDLGAGGRELIEAVVAGYEVAGRIAAAVHPHHTLSGFLPTGTCGTFGAAAAVSKLMGHDVEGILNALGNAGYLLPLSMAEHLLGGYTAKIVQGGQAASAGLTAAGLAGAGIAGPPYVLEGSALSGGFTQITTRNERNLTRIIAELGERFCISDVYFKPYTACRHTHGAAQAALSLVGKEHFDPHQIDAVHVHTYPIAALAVGRSVSADDTFVSAQFSLPYVVAACLVDKGMGPAQLSAARIGDPVILDLAGKVRIEVDPELAAAYPDKTSTRVAITLVGGRVLTQQIDIPKGDPRDPMTAGHLTDKLKRFATGRDEVDVDRIASVVLALESVSDVRELTALV